VTGFLFLAWRFCVITIGFVAAILASGLFVALLLTHGYENAGTGSGLVLSVAVMSSFIGYFAFLPAMPFIVWAELAGKRDWLFYALAGGAIAILLSALSWGAERPIGGDPVFSLIMLGAALIGGFAYWLVAGRSAGRWRDAIAPAPSGS
jgi:hypothetical protein